MTTEAEVRAFYRAPPGAWPTDDTEESVAGTDLHQTTIVNVHWGFTEAAQLARGPDESPPWKALTQTILLGCERPDGSPYRTLPDIFVYLHQIDPSRPSVAVAVDGPPVLIVEVLSPSTYDTDLDIDKGKGYSFARAGVREYLTLDPARQFVPEGGRAWRLESGIYQPWHPDSDGRWQSREIPVAIALEGSLATVYTRSGQRLHRMGEVEQTIAELRARLRALGEQ